MVEIKEEFKTKEGLDYVRFVVSEIREVGSGTKAECDAIIDEVERCEAELGLR